MSKKLIALALTTSLCLFAGVQSASAGVSLFKDYTHGTPIDKYTRSAGYYDCSNSEQKGRCTDNFNFVGEKFTVALFFREDKLDMVCSGLMKPDTLLGENARQIEVSDDQTTPYLFR